jgi:hypothetical protein
MRAATIRRGGSFFLTYNSLRFRPPISKRRFYCSMRADECRDPRFRERGDRRDEFAAVSESANLPNQGRAHHRDAPEAVMGSGEL